MVTRIVPRIAAAAAAVVLVSSDVRAQNAPVFDAKGFQQNRDYFTQLSFDHINTLTGGLTLIFAARAYLRKHPR